jgi:VWFA-related protein
MKLTAILLLPLAGLAQPASNIRVDVNLVRVPFVVKDASGRPVRDLDKSEFMMLEDGVPREIKYFWREFDQPITIGILADISQFKPPLPGEPQTTIMRFISRSFSEEDRAFLVSTNMGSRWLIMDLTNSVDGLRRGAELMGSLVPCAASHLWDRVYSSADLKLRPRSGPKALLLLTDGWDDAGGRRLDDAIQVCQRAGVVVYSIVAKDPEWIKVGDTWRRIRERPGAKSPLRAAGWLTWASTHAWERWIANRRAKGRRDLEAIARATGGAAFEASDKLNDIFDRMESDLRNQYVLGYTTPDAVESKKAHRKLQVKVTRAGLTVQAR